MPHTSYFVVHPLATGVILYQQHILSENSAALGQVIQGMNSGYARKKGQTDSKR